MKTLLIFAFLFGAHLINSSSAKQVPQEPPTTQARIAEALRRAKYRVDSNGNSLGRVVAEGNVQGFKAAEVIQGVNQGKEQLLNELAGDQLASLRLYIETFYPVALLANLETNNSKFGPLVTPNSERRAFNKASSFIAGLRSKFGGFGAQDSDLSVDLNVTSEPDQALLQLVAGSETRETRTNNAMPNVFRGLYDYTIKKNGFKTGAGKINLIDGEGHLIQCTLVSSNNSGESFCKQVKVP